MALSSLDIVHQCSARAPLLRGRPDRHRADWRTGVPLSAQRQDHRAGHPNFVVGERPKVGVLYLIDAGLSQICPCTLSIPSMSLVVTASPGFIAVPLPR